MEEEAEGGGRGDEAGGELLCAGSAPAAAWRLGGMEAALSAFASRDDEDCLPRSALSLAVSVSFQNF